MKIALGLKAHSGWAALVAVGLRGGELVVAERRRIELVEDADSDWALQPYHAAAYAPRGRARGIVERAVRSTHRVAVRELRQAVKRATAARHEIAACAVLTTAPLPDWSLDEILAVHFRLHRAEGVLFREALVRAGRACGLPVVEVLEKELQARAERALAAPIAELRRRVGALGKSIGPPWGGDQKDAALAAWIGLRAAGRPASVAVRAARATR